MHQSNGKRTVSSCFNFHSRDRSLPPVAFATLVDDVASIYIYIYVYSRGENFFENLSKLADDFVQLHGRARIVSLNSRILFVTIDSFTRHLCK